MGQTITRSEFDIIKLNEYEGKMFRSKMVDQEREIITKLHPELFLESKERGHGMIRGVTSPTQSSKTQWTIAQALLALNDGRSAVIVPRNFTGDQIQLRERVRLIEKRVAEEMKQHEAKHEAKYSVNCLTSLSNSKDDAESRRNAFRSGGYVFIALANSKQLQNLVKDSEGYPGSYDLFIDEADASDYGKESKSQEDVKRAVAFEVLKSKAYRTFCISATLMGVVLNEPKMKSDDLIRLTPPGDYRGFQDIADNAKVLPHSVHGFNKYRSWKERIEQDKNLLPFLTRFSERDPHLIGVGRPGGLRWHPQICLLNVTTSIASHKSIVEGIASHPKLGERLVVIGVNGNGIALYLPSNETTYEFKLVGDDTQPLILEPCKFTRNKRLTISSVLQYIYEANEVVNKGHADLEGCLEYANIVIVSGRCVGRGISVVSNNYEYHLPTMYFTPSPTMNIPNLIQAMGRLCGRNLGKASLELWATAEVWDCLHRGLLCEEELLTRAVGKPLIVDGEEQPLFDSLRTIPINRAKIPLARRSLTKGKDNTRSTLRLVSGNDGGRDLKDYLLADSATSLPITLSGALAKKFEKWSNPTNTTKIALTAKDIDPDTAYAVKDWPKNFVRLGDIIISEHTLNSHRHKPFMERRGDIVRVHPKLVEMFKRYF